MTDPFSRLTLRPGMAPMEARLADDIPEGPGWQYEPKWDGFRCLVFRDGAAVALSSKAGKPLERYFPEIAQAVLAIGEDRLVLDGELVLPIGDRLSFADLQMRLHPAASRIARLASETPAQLLLFDCLQAGDEVLAEHPLSERRVILDRLGPNLPAPRVQLSPCTLERDLAARWLQQSGGALDGIVAKRLDEPYRSGERTMVKHKQQRNADCVVGGYRADSAGSVASLLLGLYDAPGRLHYVGFAAAFSSAVRKALAAELAPLQGASAFDGNAPGGPSRWSRGRSTDWIALRPERVAEVAYDQVTGAHFRHGTTLLRWRPDKAPEQCTLDQLERELRPAALGRTLAETAADQAG
jgi:ATP-dependent DNA ligase